MFSPFFFQKFKNPIQVDNLIELPVSVFLSLPICTLKLMLCLYLQIMGKKRILSVWKIISQKATGHFLVSHLVLFDSWFSFSKRWRGFLLFYSTFSFMPILNLWFLLDSKWQQVPQTFRDSSKNSDRSQQHSLIDCLNPSIFVILLCMTTGYASECFDYHWYYCYLHISDHLKTL